MAGSLMRGTRVRGKRTPMAEINVTPFVDVMLVLLIVFMVTAPLLAVGIKADPPATEAANLPMAEDPVMVTVAADGKIYIQEDETSFDQLVPRLRAITEANPDVTIFVRGDSSLSYGEVMEVAGRINGAGFPINFVHRPAQN